MLRSIRKFLAWVGASILTLLVLLMLSLTAIVILIVQLAVHIS